MVVVGQGGGWAASQVSVVMGEAALRSRRTDRGRCATNIVFAPHPDAAVTAQERTCSSDLALGHGRQWVRRPPTTSARH